MEQRRCYDDVVAKQQPHQIVPYSGGGQKQLFMLSEVRPEPSELVSEAELRAADVVRPEDVLRLNAITQDYLCKPSANVYDIEFTRFKIRDLDTDQVLFEIEKPPDDASEREDQPAEAARYVRYRFSEDFLHLKRASQIIVGATVEFVVGSKPINKFRMVERHFFKDRLLKSFDFEFGFCIPNSKNTCEHIYEFPHLSPDLVKEMVECPYETRSDSFYFVDDQLIMHNKADYSYDG
ncbi:GMP-PDE, delta subunit [Ancylostoma ceylanicum]|uniref:GMP-PDE, delta subunit n=1 Tax=Ancylostoma ceylanicum TaxID=53326 RepID=A0A0D6M7X1_9BILA|nr:GMP-PDE, delta subunit [Ancylostoma ceylanicum]